jgi:hypothetical protein
VPPAGLGAFDAFAPNFWTLPRPCDQDVFNTAELPVDIAAIGQSLLVRQWHKTRILAHFGELKRFASLPNRLPLCTLLM